MSETNAVNKIRPLTVVITDENITDQLSWYVNKPPAGNGPTIYIDRRLSYHYLHRVLRRHLREYIRDINNVQPWEEYNSNHGPWIQAHADRYFEELKDQVRPY